MLIHCTLENDSVDGEGLKKYQNWYETKTLMVWRTHNEHFDEQPLKRKKAFHLIRRFPNITKKGFSRVDERKTMREKRWID